ncbi:unnamed protein product [Ilex paraguariensis]|uniref:Tify domain-containing protein n=1 Tax=Ilex paraguariensis TaxID=185542 RepID=A0ABC8U424_9AQUA
MPRDVGCLTDGEMGYDTPSRIEPKRAHQRSLDVSEQELFSNKKQATETINCRSFPGTSNVNISLRDNTCFQPFLEQYGNRLFGYEPLRTFNLPERNISSVGSGNLHMERRNFENQFGNDCLDSLSASHAMEDPSCLSHGSKNVRVNQVRDSDNSMSILMGHFPGREDNNAISVSNTYSKSDNTIALGPTYSSGEGKTIPINPIFNKASENLISMGCTFSKGDNTSMLMCHNYNKRDNSILLMGQPFDKLNGNFTSMDPQSEKAYGKIISTGAVYNMGHEELISIGPTYNRASKNFVSVDPAYDKGDGNTISMGSTHDKACTSAALMRTEHDKEDFSNLSMGQNFNKDEGLTMSFGSFQDNHEANYASGSIIRNCDFSINQPSVEAPKEPQGPGQKDLVEYYSGSILIADPAVTPITDTVTRNKEPKTPKKSPPNSFPSNVKSLLSTAILDGVPVKYVSWSRDKNLRGLIKGTNYLCGCKDCKFSKALNAYEFERHTGCKTKHPNNHIYFENGKTIYSVVQELKSTPQEMLFEAIQNVTGSPINQKNFQIWKASFQAATRELQRIYGKDEVVMPS